VHIAPRHHHPHTDMESEGAKQNNMGAHRQRRSCVFNVSNREADVTWSPDLGSGKGHGAAGLNEGVPRQGP